MLRRLVFLHLLLLVSSQEFQREVEEPKNCLRSQRAKEGDTIMVSYKGFLADGKVFDTSEGKDPISFKLGEGRVIKGWEKGLVDTCPGEQVVMVIPPELGYGSRGAGGVIPPDATLYFITTLEGIVRVNKENPSCIATKKVDSGVKVTMSSRVTLASGDIVDVSTDTLKFPSGLIKGWELGLKGACEGDEREILLGSNLAWGEQGIPNKVPAEASIIINVSVDKVEKDLVFNFLEQISSGTFNNGK